MQLQASTSHSLADVLARLSRVLDEAADAVRNLRVEDGSDLPPTLHTRHMAKLYNMTPNTVWRKAKLGKLPPPTSRPDENMTWDRDVVLEHRRRERERALALMAGS